ncbi:hypothetical protein [Planctomicrobium piriforme]|uniref:Uncharacterized protein n=1 Tax=Planctomicrobium piriforme TaxID=1576369 RepID=A0A1I3KBE4_9PLAN|nr:hypothetical protein [Planctomicrobium piriforme]SFI69767.1 hypothetical protein SAMN05421753_111175 [Planctomicrobium piriforme]
MKSKHPVSLATIMLSIAVVLYPLSFPPALLIAQRNDLAAKTFLIVYSPLLVLAESNLTLYRVFSSYCRLWHVPPYFEYETVVVPASSEELRMETDASDNECAVE